ncbi:hypothetical protein AOQ84DRAFT_274338, partial [Glonium stellatum]
EAELKKELLDLRREVARLQQKETQFRDIILSSAGTQKITDQEVIQAFADLRQKVQQLASSSTFDLANIPAISSDWTQKMKNFYAVCRPLRSRDVSNRLKARIFAILHQLILGEPYFGLKRENHTTPRNGELWDIDVMDQELTLCAVNAGAIADWRICTLNCIDLLKLPDEYSHSVAATIENFFAPLIHKRATKSQRKEMEEKILEVSKKSVELRMMMQRSKEGY